MTFRACIGFPQALVDDDSTRLKSRLTIIDGGRSAWGTKQSLCEFSGRDQSTAPMLGSAAVTAGAQEGTWSSLAAVLDAKWWADASVNDGLFVRRDADDETFTGSPCGDREARVANATLAFSFSGTMK